MQVEVITVKNEFGQDTFIAYDPILKESVFTRRKSEAEEWAKTREESVEWPDE